MVGGEPFEQLDAVHPRHHDVEQDEVERFASIGALHDPFERGQAIDGALDILVPKPTEPPGEDVAVLLVVVHHEQMRRSGNGRAPQDAGVGHLSPRA